MTGRRGAGDTTMRRVMAGLYEGPDVRTERTGEGWAVQVRMRDVGEPLGERTNVYEHHAEGQWTPVGTFPTNGHGDNALRFLKEGSHLYVGPHSRGGIQVPGRIVPFAEGREHLAEIGFCEATPAP